jgi:hypothetical protein
VLFDFQQDPAHFWNQGPMRLQIEGEDLLVGIDKDGSSRPFLPLVIPDFATLGVACLRLARQTGRSALSLDDYASELLFQMAGDNVLVCSTWVGKTVTIDYESLFADWLTFANEVHRLAVLQHPEQSSNPCWRLITEEPDPTTAASLTHPSWFADRDDCFK